MNTGVAIFLVSAVVGIAWALFQQHRLNEVAMDAERRHRRVLALREIKATITVYDVVNGREVNRRAAYPFDRMTIAASRASDALVRYRQAVNAFDKARKTLEDKRIM